jgi:alkanesulfonate monooxygenase SsuD/methylene tetrahydromethanopterin reductase-like flavin-dependent oxidoreductase (luciferase family)
MVRLTWAKRVIPIYLSAEGPRPLELAGEIADGVIVNVGLEPTLVTDAVAHVHAGARRAGRDPSAIDLWTMVRANVTDDVAGGIDEIKMELASNAHHVFRFTLAGKHVPSALADAIGRVQKGYISPPRMRRSARAPTPRCSMPSRRYAPISRSASGRPAYRPLSPTSFKVWSTRGSAASW